MRMALSNLRRPQGARLQLDDPIINPSLSYSPIFNGKEIIALCKDVKTEEVVAEESTPQSVPDGVEISPPESPTDDVSLADIHETLSELQTLFESKIARDQSQSAMFDALYREMKDYKENFLLDSLHKPVIKNLIMLYDDFVAIESQLDALMSDNSSLYIEGMEQLRNNLENFRFQLLEVLYRMDVTPYEERLERLDRKLHKTLKAIPTDNPDQDGQIAQVHKTGFYWREKIIRPEEVSIFKYRGSSGHE